MPKDKWIKIATRNLPFYRMVMIYQSFARYKKLSAGPMAIRSPLLIAASSISIAAKAIWWKLVP